jgi:hypothetical protein
LLFSIIYKKQSFYEKNHKYLNCYIQGLPQRKVNWEKILKIFNSLQIYFTPDKCLVYLAQNKYVLHIFISSMLDTIFNFSNYIRKALIIIALNCKVTFLTFNINVNNIIFNLHFFIVNNNVNNK